ncbi:MAG TPA: hypothetical protein VN673_12645, partial [Clostridia bacterium]|nr:hypothetical protein [Clostridia bacterium]
MRPEFYALTITAVILALPAPGAAAKQATLCGSEPNVERAAAWWPETRNVWTPVGWKNHLFRFNVLFSGAILAEPHPQSPFAKQHTSPYAGQGVQLEIIPSASGGIPSPRNEPYPLADSNGNRFGRQGWATN